MNSTWRGANLWKNLGRVRPNGIGSRNLIYGVFRQVKPVTTGIHISGIKEENNGHLYLVDETLDVHCPYLTSSICGTIKNSYRFKSCVQECDTGHKSYQIRYWRCSISVFEFTMTFSSIIYGDDILSENFSQHWPNSKILVGFWNKRPDAFKANIQLDGKKEKVNQILKNKMSLCFPIIRNLSWRKFHK